MAPILFEEWERSEKLFLFPAMKCFHKKRAHSLNAFVAVALVVLCSFRWSSYIQNVEPQKEHNVFWNNTRFFPFSEDSTDEIRCETIPQLLSDNNLQPSEVNSLRRSLMMSDPSCFERHLESFKQIFLSRIKKKHVQLHIPKSGGTSICKAVQKEGVLSSPGGNCWKENFCPYWCGCTDPKPTSCSELKSWHASFVMNENWLDSYCQHHTYSILIREPVGRTMSHLNHFLDAVAWRDDHLDDSKNWRLSLIQSNYMTWALSAAHEIESGRSIQFYPEKEHLKLAMKRLLEMDYIIDLSHEDEICRKDYVFKRSLNIKHPTGHKNKAMADYAADFTYEYIQATNSHDIELYKLATELINHDCDFLAKVFNDSITNA